MEMHSAYVDSTQAGQGAVPVNAAETVCLTLPGVAINGGVGCILEAAATWTTGASTTAVVARIRRGVLVTGALVGGAFSLTIGAAALAQASAQVQDMQAADVAGQQYVLTLQQTGGAANGSALFASLQATWLQ